MKDDLTILISQSMLDLTFRDAVSEIWHDWQFIAKVPNDTVKSLEVFDWVKSWK